MSCHAIPDGTVVLSKSKSLGSGGSMVAKLKLKGIDGRLKLKGIDGSVVLSKSKSLGSGGSMVEFLLDLIQVEVPFPH